MARIPLVRGGDRMVDAVDALDQGAIFSPCRRWRYLLFRRWDQEKGICAFVCLNPSTADETEDDPTVRRCIRYAKDWGFGALWVLNAYAFRATDPAAMKAQGSNALGPLNNEYLQQAALNADFVIAAWGTHCDEMREKAIKGIFNNVRKPLFVLGLTRAGHPRHPLYRRADLKPQRWTRPAPYVGE